MREDIRKFWEKESLNNIKPEISEEFPEGWDVVEFLKELYEVNDLGRIVDIGCGYGRLCTAFPPSKYLGVDISPLAIEQAKHQYPNYKFSLLEEDFPLSDSKLLYTVALHQSDEDIGRLIEQVCETTRGTVIVAEICGRDWRRPGNPPVFNREPEDYDILFRKYGKPYWQLMKKPYRRYEGWAKSDTQLSVMLFS